MSNDNEVRLKKCSEGYKVWLRAVNCALMRHTGIQWTVNRSFNVNTIRVKPTNCAIFGGISLASPAYGNVFQLLCDEWSIWFKLKLLTCVLCIHKLLHIRIYVCICEYSCDFFLIVASAQRVFNLLPIICQLSWAEPVTVYLISFCKSLFVLWVQPVVVLNIKHAFVTVCWVCKLSLKFQLILQVICRSTAISVFCLRLS